MVEPLSLSFRVFTVKLSGVQTLRSFFFLFFFFFVQFNVPSKIISLIETSQSIGGAKREYPGKTTGHTRKQNLACLTCGQCGARTYTRHSGEMIDIKVFYRTFLLLNP